MQYTMDKMTVPVDGVKLLNNSKRTGKTESRDAAGYGQFTSSDQTN